MSAPLQAHTRPGWRESLASPIGLSVRISFAVAAMLALAMVQSAEAQAQAQPKAPAAPTLAAPLGQSAGQSAEAPAVSLHGIVGGRLAILLIGRQTHTLAVGAQVASVRLLALDGDSATVEVSGRRQSLRLGESQASVSDPRGPVSAGVVSGRDLTLVADGAGHFVEACQLEDRTARCMVDTGATLVTLSQQMADQMGIRYADGESVRAQTANGAVNGWRITLRKVRLGTVEVPQVEAVVLPGAIEHVLLGNSFLRHFQFSRQDNLLRLQRKP